MGSQRVGHDWATKLNWGTYICKIAWQIQLFIWAPCHLLCKRRVDGFQWSSININQNISPGYLALAKKKKSIISFLTLFQDSVMGHVLSMTEVMHLNFGISWFPGSMEEEAQTLDFQDPGLNPLWLRYERKNLGKLLTHSTSLFSYFWWANSVMNI